MKSKRAVKKRFLGAFLILVLAAALVIFHFVNNSRSGVLGCKGSDEHKMACIEDNMVAYYKGQLSAVGMTADTSLVRRSCSGGYDKYHQYKSYGCEVAIKGLGLGQNNDMTKVRQTIATIAEVSKSYGFNKVAETGQSDVEPSLIYHGVQSYSDTESDGCYVLIYYQQESSSIQYETLCNAKTSHLLKDWPVYDPTQPTG